MTPDYNAQMQHTAERVATAPAHLDDTQETNQSLSAWLRLDHWRRLQRCDRRRRSRSPHSAPQGGLATGQGDPPTLNRSTFNERGARFV